MKLPVAVGCGGYELQLHSCLMRLLRDGHLVGAGVSQAGSARICLAPLSPTAVAAMKRKKAGRHAVYLLVETDYVPAARWLAAVLAG